MNSNNLIASLFVTQNLSNFINSFDLSFNQLVLTKSSKGFNQILTILPTDSIKNNLPKFANQLQIKSKSDDVLLIRDRSHCLLEVFNTSDLTNRSSSNLDSFFQTVSADCFCNFIAGQIGKSQKYKDSMFSGDLIASLSLLCRRYIL